MPPIHVTNLSRGDTDHGEVRFTLTTEEGKDLDFSASLADATRIVANLAKVTADLRATEEARGTNKVSVIRAETVITGSVDHDVLGTGRILLILTTPQNVSYAFALEREGALELGHRLQARSDEAAPPVGRA